MKKMNRWVEYLLVLIFLSITGTLIYGSYYANLNGGN